MLRGQDPANPSSGISPFKGPMAHPAKTPGKGHRPALAASGDAPIPLEKRRLKRHSPSNEPPFQVAHPHLDPLRP